MATKTVLGNVVTAVTNNIAKIKTAIGNATTSAAGLMSNTDKTKLDGVEASANKTTIVNNLTATTAGSALDATQGKALSDKITSLNDSLTNSGMFLTGGSALSVGRNITFDQLISRANNSIVVFSNWDDTTHFPAMYGCGIIFCPLDPSRNEILYMATGVMYCGVYKMTTGNISWTKCSN